MRLTVLTWVKIPLVLAVSLVLVACGDDDGGDGGGGQADPVTLVRQGWSAFEALDFLTAQDLFEQAISTGPLTSDAYSGAGWTAFQLGDLEHARTRWEQGLERDAASFDIRAGIGFLEFQLDNYQPAIDMFQGLLDDNGNYSFVHIPGLDFRDIRVTIAACQYVIGDFAAALESVQALNPVFTADIDTPEGVNRLGEEIERLTDVYRG